MHLMNLLLLIIPVCSLSYLDIPLARESTIYHHAAFDQLLNIKTFIIYVQFLVCSALIYGIILRYT